MHLFSLGSSKSEIKVRPESSQEMLPSDHSIIIRFGSHCFSLPQSVTSKSSFQKSSLGVALNSTKTSDFHLQDGTVVTRISHTELQVERPPHTGSDHLADFSLLTDHLLGRKPLEAFGFSSIADAYQRLLGEVKFWGLHKSVVELPYRLWTRRRWSDLAGVYGLSRSDDELLKMHPVAIQLEDGTVQGVRVLSKMDLEAKETKSYVSTMLHAESELQKVVGVFESMEYLIVMIDSNLDRHSQTHTRTDEEIDSPSTSVPEAATPTFSSPSTVASLSGRDGAESKFANQILIKLPKTNKIVAYDFSRHEHIRVPNGRDFPLFYRRDDRHVFCFSSSFSLELQELTDAMSGLSKIRCGLSRVGNEPKCAPFGAPPTPPPQTAATSMMALFKTQGTKKDSWQCYHPQLSARYAPSMKWIKDFGEVHRIRLFPWGALLVLSKPDSPFAILSIDHPGLKKVYGDRITICIRGFPHNFLTRDDIDITVTPGLERVYLCCCSQIASTSIVPQNSRIDFEIAEQPNRKYRLRLVHVDIPEGAPSGSSLGYLHCVGLFSEFDPKTCKRLN